MKIALKRVTGNDLKTLMDWRNSEEISKTLFTDVTLTMEGQIKWYKKLCKDESQIRWIVFADDKPIGTMFLTDIDYFNKRCEHGWFIAEKEYRSINLALSLRWNMYDYVFDRLGLNRLYGYVLAENKGVVRLIKIGGPELEGIMKQHIFKRGEFHDVVVFGITKEMWHNRRSEFTYEKFDME